MEVAEILSPQAIAVGGSVRSKKGVLEAVAGLIANRYPNLQRIDIFTSLLAREKLGSTGVGHGVAIPHGRVDFIGQVAGAFLTVPGGVNFDAVDNQPVDLFFALLVPSNTTDEHLQILAQLAEMFSDRELLSRIRTATSSEEIYALLVGWVPGA
jgi:PTS system nitrogen regulatory IIA component